MIRGLTSLEAGAPRAIPRASTAEMSALDEPEHHARTETEYNNYVYYQGAVQGTGAKHACHEATEDSGEERNNDTYYQARGTTLTSTPRRDAAEGTTPTGRRFRGNNIPNRRAHEKSRTIRWTAAEWNRRGSNFPTKRKTRPGTASSQRGRGGRSGRRSHPGPHQHSTRATRQDGGHR